MRIDRVQAGEDEIVVPSLFQVEVAAGLARSGMSRDKVERFVEELLASAEIVTIGPLRARQIQRVAMQTRLRAADAAYVWLAGREGVPLVTVDEQVFERAGTVCAVERP